MELERFVEQSLVEVLRAVVSARAKAKEDGNIGKIVADRGPDMQGLRDIQFDIAVTTKDLGEGKAEICVFGLGVGGGIENENSVTSRIQFKVPIQFRA